MKRHLSIFVIIFLLSIGQVSYAATDNNVGFVENGVWYSQTPKVEGDNVDIHTAIWNGTTNEVKAHIEFYDSTLLLGARDVTLAPNTLSDVRIGWKVTAGDHSISAKISKSSSITDGKSTTISIENNSVESLRINISKKVAVTSGADTPIDTIAKKVASSLPAQVAAPVTHTALSIDTFRENTKESIDLNIKSTNEKIVELNTPVKKSTTDKTAKTSKASATDSLSGTEKPIAYVELFFLSIASFIFTQKVIFYGLGVLILFFILRFIFRLIRRRRW